MTLSMSVMSWGLDHLVDVLNVCKCCDDTSHVQAERLWMARPAHCRAGQRAVFVATQLGPFRRGQNQQQS